jgi:hypothetical protein
MPQSECLFPAKKTWRNRTDSAMPLPVQNRLLNLLCA